MPGERACANAAAAASTLQRETVRSYLECCVARSHLDISVKTAIICPKRFSVLPDPGTTRVIADDTHVLYTRLIHKLILWNVSFSCNRADVQLYNIQGYTTTDIFYILDSEANVMFILLLWFDRCVLSDAFLGFHLFLIPSFYFLKNNLITDFNFCNKPPLELQTHSHISDPCPVQDHKVWKIWRGENNRIRRVKVINPICLTSTCGREHEPGEIPIKPWPSPQLSLRA